MLKIAYQEFSKDAIIAPEIIDFYEMESRSWEGVIKQIIQHIGSEYFHGTTTLLTDNHDHAEIEAEFRREYAALTRNSTRLLVMFFDSYEYVQEIQNNWFEIYLFPLFSMEKGFLNNVRIIISGRMKVQLSKIGKNLKSYELSGLNNIETQEFLENHFSVQTEERERRHLDREIVDFLLDLPNMRTIQDARRALIESAGLPRELRQQIKYIDPAKDFFHSLISTCNDYGPDEKGDHCVEHILDAAKERVGEPKREQSDKFIRHLRKANLLPKIHTFTDGHPISLDLVH
jgi:hypothetical protein